MSYLVLARKFRPQSFEGVSGQEHVTTTLLNAIKRNKVAHAYLFAGPRGVGKTSIARIFSKCLNCEKGPTVTPCLKCANCTAIANGTSLAVREIDGASHNSVDNVRELIENFRSLPAPGSKYKIYIIDEVHMLSIAAFNALLKSLEEPPPNTVFMMATTEVHKIPDTILSRCQRHDLRALSQAEVVARLSEIAKAESIKAEPEVLRMIARLSEGSMRDAQTLLDRVQSYTEGTLSAVDAGRVLGAVDRAALFKLSQGVFERQPSAVLAELDRIFSFAVDPSLFIREFVGHWRELLMAKAGGVEALAPLGLVGGEVDALVAHVGGVSLRDVQDLVTLAREGADSASRSSFPRYALEALLVKMATREPVEDLKNLIVQLREVVAKGGLNAAHVKSDSPQIIRHAPPMPPSPAPQKSATDAPKKSTEDGVSSLRWEDFVESARREGGAILAEQLKRLALISFVKGKLAVKGPEFSVNYCKGNMEKLQQLLVKYSKTSPWAIDISISDTGQKEDSIHHVETKQAVKSREEKTQSVAQHPKIQSLQKIFPGTKIEAVKFKEE